MTSPNKPSPIKPERPGFFRRISSRLSTRSDTQEIEIPQPPRKYNYEDRVFNTTVVDSENKPTREIRIVLGWHFDSKDKQTWFYSLTDEARKIFEWVEDKDLELLSRFVPPKATEQTKKVTS